MKQVFFLLFALSLSASAQSINPTRWQEIDGSPSVSAPTTVKFTNGSLSCTGKVCTVTISAGSSPGGATTTAQYNNAGAFGGSTGITFTATQATITGARFVGSLRDANDLILIAPTATASAVNYFTMANAAAGGNLLFGAAGSSTDVAIGISGKGTNGLIGLNKTSSLAASVHVATTATSVVGFRVDGGGAAARIAEFTVSGNASLPNIVGVAPQGGLIVARSIDTAAPDGTVNFDFRGPNIHQMTFGAGNATITFSNVTDLNSGWVTITLIQDTGGSRTMTWPSTVKWTGGVAPTLTTAASARDVFHFFCDGTNIYEIARALDVK